MKVLYAINLLSSFSVQNHLLWYTKDTNSTKKSKQNVGIFCFWQYLIFVPTALPNFSLKNSYIVGFKCNKYIRRKNKSRLFCVSLKWRMKILGIAAWPLALHILKKVFKLLIWAFYFSSNFFAQRIKACVKVNFALRQLTVLGIFISAISFLPTAVSRRPRHFVFFFQPSSGICKPGGHLNKKHCRVCASRNIVKFLKPNNSQLYWAFFNFVNTI